MPSEQETLEMNRDSTDARDVLLQWTDATGTTWRVSRTYSWKRQQWEAAIASKARDTWFERERMVLDEKEVFEHEG
jgi:hypothetical protein